MKEYFKCITLIGLLTILDASITFSLLQLKPLNANSIYLVSACSIPSLIAIFYIYTYKKKYILFSFPVSFRKVILYSLLGISVWVVLNIPINYYRGHDIYLFENINNTSIGLVLLTILMTPITTEVIYRGILSEYLLKNNKSELSVLISTSLIYSLSIFSYLDFETVIYRLLFAIICSLVYLKERSVIYLVLIALIYTALSFIIEFPK